MAPNWLMIALLSDFDDLNSFVKRYI